MDNNSSGYCDHFKCIIFFVLLLFSYFSPPFKAHLPYFIGLFPLFSNISLHFLPSCSFFIPFFKFRNFSRNSFVSLSIFPAIFPFFTIFSSFSEFFVLFRIFFTLLGFFIFRSIFFYSTRILSVSFIFSLFLFTFAFFWLIPFSSDFSSFSTFSSISSHFRQIFHSVFHLKPKNLKFSFTFSHQLIVTRSLYFHYHDISLIIHYLFRKILMQFSKFPRQSTNFYETWEHRLTKSDKARFIQRTPHKNEADLFNKVSVASAERLSKRSTRASAKMRCVRFDVRTVYWLGESASIFQFDSSSLRMMRVSIECREQSDSVYVWVNVSQSPCMERTWKHFQCQQPAHAATCESKQNDYSWLFSWSTGNMYHMLVDFPSWPGCEENRTRKRSEKC